jgi:hypothetical protein
MKKFTVAGTSTLNGVTKVRFANDLVDRIKMLARNNHENIELVELEGEFTKAEICKMLLEHERFQSEAQQSAIYDYVVRNAREIKNEIESLMTL